MPGLPECTPSAPRDPAPGDRRPLRRHAHEHDHGEGRHDDLLQGLGHGSGRHLLARLAVELGCLGRPDAVPRAARLPRRRPRSPWPWPIQPGVDRQRHGRLCRRPRRGDRGPGSHGHHDGRSLDRRRRGGPLHRPARHEARRQGRADRRRAAGPGEVAGQSRGPADRDVRRHADRARQRSRAVLQGVRGPVLRRQSPGTPRSRRVCWTSSGSGACRAA